MITHTPLRANRHFLLRIVRRLPACAQLSNPAESDGRGWTILKGGNRGGDAAAIGDSDALWGFSDSRLGLKDCRQHGAAEERRAFG
jgi:hypothetical protein